jgi:hypothetical protein
VVTGECYAPARWLFGWGLFCVLRRSLTGSHWYSDSVSTYCRRGRASLWWRGPRPGVAGPLPCIRSSFGGSPRAFGVCKGLRIYFGGQPLSGPVVLTVWRARLVLGGPASTGTAQSIFSNGSVPAGNGHFCAIFP